ncbi:MAG: xanthine dehydrogenase family protein [Acidobacteria bacterium]|nr:xanthine dehydrogenase family protein [Acidobacteriota bacterium]
MKNSISTPVDRLDGPEKASGRAIYTDDIRPDGLLYARTLRADRPRARILHIRLPDIPVGYFIVDKNDVPGHNRIKMLEDDWPFFAEEVINHVGEPILLVVGPDREKVNVILHGIKVEYEDLPAVLSIKDAIAAKNPIFGDDNCFASYQFQKGDPDPVFTDAKTIIKGEFKTGYHEQAYMEPQGVIGNYVNGKLTVTGSMQCPYYVKNAMVQLTGFPENQVQIIQATTGGAFGGKEEYPSLLAGHVAIAAIKTGKPVKLVLERGEDLAVTTKRHPSISRYRSAVDENGRVIAMEADITLDGGAYAGLSAVVLQRALFAAIGVYDIPNVTVRGRVLSTNQVPSGAFRGFGAPQAFFAVEMHMEQIASELGMNPLTFKEIHLVKQGDTTATGGLLRDEIKIREMLSRVLKMSDYRKKEGIFASGNGRFRSGIGLGLYLHGCGFTGKGEDTIHGTATIRKLTEDRAEILVSNVEMGQGAQTTLRKIVATTLGLPIQNIDYPNPDTDRVPDSGPTVASRTVIIVGHLLESAAKELKARWNENETFSVSKSYRHPSYIKWNQDTLQGDAYPAYSWGVVAVEVQVDTLTYETTIKKVWTVHDVGVAIDEDIIRGQVEGGILQGLGYASIEVMDTANGAYRQHNFTDYIIPTAVDAPVIESELVDNPYEYGPFGAKCAGELPIAGAAPAYAAAVSRALGIPVHEIPVKPEALIKGLKE